MQCCVTLLSWYTINHQKAYDRNGWLEKKFFCCLQGMYLKNKTLSIAALHIVRSCHLKDKLLYDTDQFYNFLASLYTMAREDEFKI